MGGWTMIPLAALCILIYTAAFRLLAYFANRDWRRLSEEEWQHWVRHPEHARGEVGEIIRYTQDDVRNLDEVHQRFAEVASSKLPAIDRRLVFLNILITIAPLIGLLGTVLGMLLTFQAIGLGGGEMTDMMATGISQALFPPEVGLCVALPGMALVYVIKRKRQQYEAFIARLESSTIRHFKALKLGVHEPASPPVRTRANAPASYLPPGEPATA
jgi:biopolymer transport protein ExbB